MGDAPYTAENKGDHTGCGGTGPWVRKITLKNANFTILAIFIKMCFHVVKPNFHYFERILCRHFLQKMTILCHVNLFSKKDWLMMTFTKMTIFLSIISQKK